MTEEQTRWIEGTRLWLVGQRNLVEQTKASIEYSNKEISLHEAHIENSKALAAHYQNEIDRTEAVLYNYLKDNQ